MISLCTARTLTLSKATRYPRRALGCLRAFALPLCIAWGLTLSCTETTSEHFIGSAVVEAQTYQVGPAIQGQILAMHADEGDEIGAGQLMALLDTVPPKLALAEVQAAAAELQQRIAAHRAQLEATKSEVRGIKRELDRVRPLVENGSVPSQQLDQLQTKYESAQFNQKAAAATLSAVSAKSRTLEARTAQIEDQLRRCRITAPVSGMVLTRYRSLGEVAGPAAPLFEIASYDTVWTDFFVPQPLLGEMSVGRAVRIRVDTGDESQAATFVPARISWVSDEAEFSPKNVQTRDARNELVFRVRAEAANPNRLLKRGLPVEVWREAPDGAGSDS